ncbi:MAG: DNA polymerase III subunit beta [Patescibacteria group bacterium]
MKIELKKNIVQEMLGKAVRLVGKHITLPVLSCVLFDLKKDGVLTIRSTNLDLGLETKTRTQNKEETAFAVPGNIFLNTLSSIEDQDIYLEEDNNNLKIISSKKEATIKCMPKDDFPSIPKVENKNYLEISSEDLVHGLRAVWYSASVSNIKPELSSVYIHELDNTLVFVSTDSFRLSEKSLHVKNISDFPTTLIPQKNVSEIIKILETFSGKVKLIFDKNQLAIEMGDTYIVSRLIDGSFPDYKQIIPKSFSTKITLLKSDIVSALKASNIFNDSLNQVKLSINKEKNILEIKTKNNDIGEYKETIKASIEGESLELNFNSRYIADSFQSIASDSLTLEFGGLGKPLIIKGVSDKSFMYMVMPMNR